jgi:hypothetical protein
VPPVLGSGDGPVKIRLAAILPGLGLAAALTITTIQGVGTHKADPCSQYAVDFHGHRIYNYPESVYVPCGGGVNSTTKFVVR